MTAAQPKDLAPTDVLAELEARWRDLTAAWDVDAARAFGDALEALVDRAQGALSDRATDLVTYLAPFADGSLVPNRTQLSRLSLLAGALFTSDPSTTAAAPTAPAVPSIPSAPPRPVEARNTVCLLEITEALAPGLSASLTERGYQVRHFLDPADLSQYLATTRPGVLMLESARLRLLPMLARALGEASPGTPLGAALVVLSGSRDITHRLLAMRAGATAFFGAPLDSYRIVARIEELLGREQSSGHRVLLVDADREHSAQCGRWLVDQGMTARLAGDGATALAAVAEFRPDLVLMSFDLPDARGFEVAQAIHAQPEAATLPIVLYAEDVDDAQRFDAIAAGAEDVLLKPLKPRHLTSVIRSRVQRSQWLRGQAAQVAGRDPRTGLYLRSYLFEKLAGANTRQHALLFVALDRADRLREAVGLVGWAQFELELAQAFRESLASGDVAAVLHDFAYLVLVQREHRDQVTELAERLRHKLAERRAGGGDSAQPVTASVGITALDDGGESVEARVARAEAGTLAAGRVGGNRTLWYEPAEATLVRADPQLAVHAVLTRPWHEGHARVEFHPIVPLAGKLAGQFDLVYALVSANEPGARADYAQYAPVARELQALRDVERRRFTAALEARSSRLKLGRQVRLFLPVLAETLLDAELVTWLLEQLRERRLSGTGLTLELDSAALLDRRAELAEPIRTLRQAGVRLGLSDYGRDFATVHVLSQLTLDFLRLDAEIVQDTSSDKALNSTLLALIRKAHHLGAVVLAPKVESLERAHVLLRLGVDYGVGDGLARAVAEPEFDFSRPIW